MHSYIETFDDGPGGWHTQQDNFTQYRRLEDQPGLLTSRSPWFVDYNHAPPGGGYLHLLFCLLTKGPFGEAAMEIGGRNRFWEDGCPRDFTNAKLTLRLKGELELRGAQFCFWAQADANDTIANWCYTAEPIRVTREWSEQSITIVPDEKRWTFMGSRHNRTDSYGYAPLEQVLSDVNIDIILVLFPLNVVPMGPIDGDMHQLRPVVDYPIWHSKLPEGYVTLDTIRIDFPNS